MRFLKSALIIINFLIHAQASAQALNEDLPNTIAELIEEIGTSQNYKSALWSPRAQITMDLSSLPNLIRTRDNKSNHFYFSNEYCILYSEEFNKPNILRISKNSRYLFNDINIITDFLTSRGVLATQVNMKLVNRFQTVKNLEIECIFPPNYLDLTSHPSLIFEGGLEGIILYLPSILF